MIVYDGLLRGTNRSLHRFPGTPGRTSPRSVRAPWIFPHPQRIIERCASPRRTALFFSGPDGTHAQEAKREGREDRPVA
jgi:hypothetical protein